MMRIRAAIALAFAAALLAGCGGSSTVADGGIGGTGITRGTVTDVSSITVNGRRLSTTEAEIRINGQMGTLSEIDPGHVVRVEADFDANEAEAIHFRPEVQGPVDATSVRDRTDTGTLTVLGHAVVVDGDTQVADFTDAGAIVAGDRVQVSGLVSDDGTLQATRVEMAGAKDRILGTMHNPELAGGDTLRMGGQTVDHSSATSVSFPGGSPSGGDEIVVAGSVDAEGILQADTIEPATLIGGSSGDAVEVSGFVQRAAGGDDLALAGHRLLVSSDDVVDGDRDDLVNGQRIRVQGELRSGRRIEVFRVELLP